MRELIFKENNKIYWNKISEEIIKNHKIDEFLPLFLSSDLKISQRASAFFMTIVNINPKVFLPFQNELIKCLENKPNIPQRRNLMRWFLTVELKESHQGIILHKAFEFLENTEEEIATKCYALWNIYHFTKKYPELIPELISLIELLKQQKSTPAILSASRNILKKLKVYTIYK